MAQCTICADKARKKIDAALVKEGATIRGTAATFRVSEDALARDVKNGHVLARIAKAQKAQDVVEADNLLKEINAIQKHQQTIFTEERERKGFDDRTGKEIVKPNNRLALDALREQAKVIEIKGKILGAFNKDKIPGDNPLPTTMAITPESLKKIGDILAKQ